MNCIRVCDRTDHEELLEVYMNTYPNNRRSLTAVRTVRFVSTALIACAMTATTFAAFASDRSDEPRQQSVRISDLDLTTQADTARAYQRIAAAARNVCIDFDGRGLSKRALFLRCIDESTANAIAKLDLPALTQYAQTRGNPLLLTRAALNDGRAVLEK
jgi:UrcA family protein